MSKTHFRPSEVGRMLNKKAGLIRQRITILERKGIVFKTESNGYRLASEEQVKLIASMGNDEENVLDTSGLYLDQMGNKIRILREELKKSQQFTQDTQQKLNRAENVYSAMLEEMELDEKTRNELSVVLTPTDV